MWLPGRSSFSPPGSYHHRLGRLGYNPDKNLHHPHQSRHTHRLWPLVDENPFPRNQEYSGLPHGRALLHVLEYVCGWKITRTRHASHYGRRLLQHINNPAIERIIYETLGVQLGPVTHLCTRSRTNPRLTWRKMCTGEAHKYRIAHRRTYKGI